VVGADQPVHRHDHHPAHARGITGELAPQPVEGRTDRAQRRRGGESGAGAAAQQFHAGRSRHPMRLDMGDQRRADDDGIQGGLRAGGRARF
jgi:hypothetical protein